VALDPPVGVPPVELPPVPVMLPPLGCPPTAGPPPDPDGFDGSGSHAPERNPRVKPTHPVHEKRILSPHGRLRLRLIQVYHEQDSDHACWPRTTWAWAYRRGQWSTRWLATPGQRPLLAALRDEDSSPHCRRESARRVPDPRGLVVPKSPAGAQDTGAEALMRSEYAEPFLLTSAQDRRDAPVPIERHDITRVDATGDATIRPPIGRFLAQTCRHCRERVGLSWVWP